MKKEFSKFFIASLKRTAMNVSPLVRKKQKLIAEIADKEEELKLLQVQLDVYEAPIKEVTGGFTTEDLVVRTVEITDKMDKEGKPVKITKWNLKYPDTIIPPVEATEVEDNTVETTNESLSMETEEGTEELETISPDNFKYN